MYFHFLIEDQSGKELIRLIMEKLKAARPEAEIEYKLHHFKGGGNCPKKSEYKAMKNAPKTGALLNDLPNNLIGLRGLADWPNAALVVVVDADKKDVEAFREELRKLGDRFAPKVDKIWAVAVQEIESWLLGDEQALRAAYPNAKTQLLRGYDENVDGNWEKLAEVVYPGGLTALNKEKSKKSYTVVGAQKAEWAKKIGAELNLDANLSPSFQLFRDEIYRRIENALSNK